MVFFENERSQVRTLRVSFREIARIFNTLGGFYLGWRWLSISVAKMLLEPTTATFINISGQII